MKKLLMDDFFCCYPNVVAHLTGINKHAIVKVLDDSIYHFE